MNSMERPGSRVELVASSPHPNISTSHDNQNFQSFPQSSGRLEDGTASPANIHSEPTNFSINSEPTNFSINHRNTKLVSLNQRSELSLNQSTDLPPHQRTELPSLSQRPDSSAPPNMDISSLGRGAINMDLNTAGRVVLEHLSGSVRTPVNIDLNTVSRSLLEQLSHNQRAALAMAGGTDPLVTRAAIERAMNLDMEAAAAGVGVSLSEPPPAYSASQSTLPHTAGIHYATTSHPAYQQGFHDTLRGEGPSGHGNM